jgi:hypothetical protein
MITARAAVRLSALRAVLRPVTVSAFSSGKLSWFTQFFNALSSCLLLTLSQSCIMGSSSHAGTGTLCRRLWRVLGVYWGWDLVERSERCFACWRSRVQASEVAVSQRFILICRWLREVAVPDCSLLLTVCCYPGNTLCSQSLEPPAG